MSMTIFDNKRKREQIIYNFHSFGNEGCPLNPTGSFRDNVRLFLEQCTELLDYEVDGMPVHCTLLVIESKHSVLPLYTIEEHVQNSSQPYCVHCRCTGWSGNFVSKRKYHLIIPSNSEWSRRLEDGVLDLQTHLLHGLIHCNGFGHLLCINGIEGGSKYLSGKEIMDLWDRICTNLRARKISVEDVSKKQSMDLRLLYGIAHGHTWFGRWGYKFYRGSFGVTQENYNEAIAILSSLELDNIMDEFSDVKQYREMKKMITHYRDLSKTQLITLRDLLRFMLTLTSCPCTQSQQKKCYQLEASASYSWIRCPNSKPKMKVISKKQWLKEKGTTYRTLNSLVSSLDSRWNPRRLQHTAEVIVNALKENRVDKFNQGGMTRQDVRDAARVHIGDTGLIDYVMKMLNNVIVGHHIVRRMVNPKTRILEYSLHEFADAFRPVKVAESLEDIDTEDASSASFVPGVNVYSDVAYLYANVLSNYTESESTRIAVQVILDSKHFVKEWPFLGDDQQILRFICKVVLNLIDIGPIQRRDLTPGEIVIVPIYATLMDLKQAAQLALRDTYCILDKFVVTEIKDMEEFGEEKLLFGSAKSGAELLLRGYNIDYNINQLRYEGGPETWKVSCQCGADDDDGERMVACDICEVWHHTRCIGIGDSETVPPLFICQACCWEMKPLQKLESPDLLMFPTVEYGAELIY